MCLHRAAAMTLRTVLLSLQALLAAPEPDDPQDAVVARQYKEQQSIFRKTAKHWANAYAGGEAFHCLFIVHRYIVWICLWGQLCTCTIKISWD